MYKVVIVEDEDIIRKGLLYTIPWGELECSVIGEARNGIEGEEAIRVLSPDIVITDVTMPIKDGLEMLRDTIREFDYVAIILSGYSEFEYARTAIQYGVAAYLLKPLNMKELKDTIFSARKKVDEKRSYRIHKEKVRSMLDMEILPEVNVKNSGDVIATAMLDYVKEHYSEKILMSDLERNCNYSGVVLNRRFKAQMGITFNEYLNRYRIRKSVEMLNEGSSVHEAAAACGFSEYKYFNTVFRKYVGYSPKDFLSMLQSAQI